MPGLAQGGAGVAGAVGRIAEHLQIVCGVLVAVEQFQPDDGLVVARAGGFGEPPVGEQRGVRLDRSRPTRRIAAISWVIVSWVATASSSTTESSARRDFPCSTPVSATTARTASKIRFGWSERASRRRQ